MINFYLTGGNNNGEYQNLPHLSNGGYVSLCPLRNGDTDTVINGVSEFNKANAKNEYSCIAMKNESGVKTNIKINAVNPDDAACKISIAVVMPSIDEDNNKFFERIMDKYSAPYYADFDDMCGVFEIPRMVQGDVIGIWIKRMPITPIPQPISAEELDRMFTEKLSLPTVDMFTIDVAYDE